MFTGLLLPGKQLRSRASATPSSARALPSSPLLICLHNSMGANSGLMRGVRPLAKRAGQQAKQARVAVQAARTLITATTSTVQTPASVSRQSATPAVAGK